MKRLYLLVILFLLPIAMLFSETKQDEESGKDYYPSLGPQAYIRPMLGAGGIPLNPLRGTDANGKPSYAYGELDPNAAGGMWNDNNVPPNKGQYTPKEMIAFGGIGNMNKNEAKASSYTLSVSCPQGFYFVSQSNPSYRRPFVLYVIPKAIEKPKDHKKAVEVMGPITTLEDKSPSVTYTYVKGNGENGLANGNQLKVDTGKKGFQQTQKYPTPGWEWLWPVSYSERDVNAYFTSYTTWFDLVLGLPGEIANDELHYTDGITYPLAVADDYTALVTLTVTANFTNGTPSQTVSVTIPFSGFYETNQAEKKDASVSMYVRPDLNAGNIDVKSDKEQKIASLNIQSVYDGSKPGKSYGVFLSSNSDPFVAGTRFRLERDNLDFGDPRTPYNSVTYTAYLKRHTSYNPSNIGEVDVSYLQVNNKAYLGPDYVTQYNAVDSMYMYPIYKDHELGHRPQGLRSFEFDGEVTIKIDTSDVIMDAGRYTSEIYVHVVDL